MGPNTLVTQLKGNTQMLPLKTRGPSLTLAHTNKLEKFKYVQESFCFFFLISLKNFDEYV
jgi:hypothetical protein